MTDIVERLREDKYVGGKWVMQEAAEEIERLREALEQYRNGDYMGYVTLPCGWDDEGELARYALNGLSLENYVLDMEKEHARENS